LDATGIVFIDAEVDFSSKKILDLGAVKESGQEFHINSSSAFSEFLRGIIYVCGHNILNHDLKYLEKEMINSGVKRFIDTLYLSPLLYPTKKYHHLIKDDKLTVDELSNPLNDSKKARDLFNTEVAAFKSLDSQLQQIYYDLLNNYPEF
jgi:ATP-dependent DNA helicase RecQ